MRTILLLGLLALTACGGGIREWDPFTHEPPRPDLGIQADTNSAYAYFAHGERLMRDSPRRAADAFYWAARLDPGWADPLYAHRMAVFMAHPEVFSAYMNNQSGARQSPGVQRADSLYSRALRMNPFLRNRFDAPAVRVMLAWSIEREIRRNDATAFVDRMALDGMIDRYLRTAPPQMQGWIAHSEGRFPQAVTYYRTALDRGSSAPGLRADLARALFLSGRYGEAREMMASAVEGMEEDEEERLVRVYESKALLEHAMGLIHEQLDDPAGARAAYARALQEDLSYHAAHIRLGELALVEGDTLTAVSQLALAAQIGEHDAGIRYQHGSLLRRIGEFDAARAELERAIELEPLFALPYFELARALEENGRLDDAAGQYRAYLDRASRDAPSRREAEARLQQLERVAGPAEGSR